MTAQQLKNAILQEAIQGRLVPQDPNDEPASILLERIRKEKQQLVKEGKLKKKDLEEKPISEDEIPFEIPESWEWCRITSLLILLTDGTHNSPPSYTQGDYKYITAKNIKPEGIDLTNVTYVTKEIHDVIYSRCNPEYGDILYIKDGATAGIVTINNLKEPFSLLSSVALLKQSRVIDGRYLLSYLRSPYCYNMVRASMKGAAITRITLRMIQEWLVPLPPLAEQKRIVAKIEELLPKVEEYGKAQEKLNKLNEELPEKLKKSVLQEAIEGRLVPQDLNDEPASVLLERIRKEKQQLVKEGKLKKKDLEEKPISEDEIPFEIPESWEWVRISDIVNVVMGQSPDGNDVYESSHEENAYEFHQGKICFTEKYISPSGKWCNKPARIAEIDSLLVCVRAPIGDVNITQREIGIGRGLASIKGFCDIKTEFLYYWMKAHKRNLVDQGTGSTFKAITVEVLKNQPFPLPPLAEQKRIVAKIEQLLGEINKLNA